MPHGSAREDASALVDRARDAVLVYEQTRPSADGIGKRYMGREIAHVMSQVGAGWLERSERWQQERPDLLINELGLDRGMVVADVGAGTGYHTVLLARAVGDNGVVYAVDLQPQMLQRLERNMRRQGIDQYRAVLATPEDPRLPAGALDLILMVDVYHELEHPHEVLHQLITALKPGGRIAFVEYRAEDARVPIKALHKMSEAQIRREAEASGLRWERTFGGLPWQHLVVFRKAS